MRLKSFTAPSMAEAMALLRKELGDDAIIVSTQRANGGDVRITAALEAEDPDEDLPGFSGGATQAAVDAVRAALEQHGTPARLVDKMVAAARATQLEDATLACAAALESVFAFAPLPELAAPRPFMMIGPPGAGKTMVVAKLAARSVIKGRAVSVITTDNQRAGAMEQLVAFTKILRIDLKSVRGADALRRQVLTAKSQADIIYIDSPGFNPFREADMEFLRGLIEAADVEPILVMAAGGDAQEAAEIGESFGAAGATRLFSTRLDMTRRLGAIMAAADAAQLMLCDCSSTPHVAHGVSPLSPVAMARLILPPSVQTSVKDETFWTEAQ
jgi:flagellar biosynthesis protein FlhF